MLMKNKLKNEKHFFLILDTHPHKVNWKKLSNPSKYELILFKLPKNKLFAGAYEKLKKKGQSKYFSKIINLKNFDEKELRLKIKKVISDLKKSGVNSKSISIVTDGELFVLKSAKLRTELKINGPKLKQLIPFRNKIAAKRKLMDLSSHLSKYIKFNSKKYQKNPQGYINFIVKKLRFPIFSKPIDLVSSLGVEKINNYEELKNWCDKFKEVDFMMLEEFISGKAYHCDSLIKNGAILRTLVAEKLNPSADFILGKPTGSLVLLKDDKTYKKIIAFNKRVLKYLSPPDGCVDMDIIKTASGKLMFLEAGSRTPNEYIPEMYEVFTGIDFYLAHYQLQMKIRPNISEKKGPYSAWITVPINDTGIIEKHNHKLNIVSNYKIYWKNRIGDYVKKSTALIEFSNIVLLKNYNFAQLKKDFYSLNHYKFYSIKSKNRTKAYSYTKKDDLIQLKFIHKLF